MPADDSLQNPEPMEESPLRGFADVLVYGTFAGCVVLLTAAVAIPNMVRGASRSTKLKWLERQHDIQQTVQICERPSDGLH